MKHLFSVLALMISVPAIATEIKIDASPCAQEISVSASRAKLSDVLIRLAERMHFTLKFDPASDRQITLERSADPTTVLRELLNGGNFMQIDKPRDICDGRVVVAQVWVLPRGEAVPYFTYVPEAAGIALQPFDRTGDVPDVPSPPRGVRRTMSEAEWQQMKQDYKDGKIAGDPETGKPIPIEEYREKIRQKESQ